MADQADLLARGREASALWGDLAAKVPTMPAQGRTDEVTGHRLGALTLGITREELVEVLMQTACSTGVPTSVSALNAAADVLTL